MSTICGVCKGPHGCICSTHSHSQQSYHPAFTHSYPPIYQWPRTFPSAPVLPAQLPISFSNNGQAATSAYGFQNTFQATYGSTPAPPYPNEPPAFRVALSDHTPTFVNSSPPAAATSTSSASKKRKSGREGSSGRRKKQNTNVNTSGATPPVSATTLQPQAAPSAPAPSVPGVGPQHPSSQPPESRVAAHPSLLRRAGPTIAIEGSLLVSESRED
ncbi:unnamed protein product [Cyclocybe aegerita]|uniref:Uncharacterized protein n=1 Tax=Cyclocybe aegerita TaxID=1973307 RepID=A0A8S0VRW3_CYCAE|nr:unnamed protein product [Cyclocybe aegerita]